MKLRLIATLIAAAVSVAGCNFTRTPDPAVSSRDAEFMARVPDAVIDTNYDRFLVDNSTGEAPGTIVIDSKANLLFFTLPGNKAMRYGISTGSEAFGWTGTAFVRRKAEWPRWTPPAEMLERWPHLRPQAGGMAGGPANPLGARALYLYDTEGRDTLYRIHGTNEPEKIGQSVSSGCIRMRNIDAIDLYNRVSLNTRVVVR